MSSLGPFMGSFGSGGGAPAAAEAVEEVKEEEAPAVEKTHFDIELSSFEGISKALGRNF